MKTYGEANTTSKEKTDMLNETTISVMHALKLHGMAKGFELRLGDSKQAGLSHAEFTGMVEFAIQNLMNNL